jgi:hypothetical protein
MGYLLSGFRANSSGSDATLPQAGADFIFTLSNFFY